ncbi:hypothetical protein ABLO27_13935 [Roseibium sp. SCPC15]|uniref:hypothetical protein n=1 Tax=Roseibium sp. SCP15 TaxID=3141376 RepID=UPI00333A7A16
MQICLDELKLVSAQRHGQCKIKVEFYRAFACAASVGTKIVQIVEAARPAKRV